MSRRGNNIRKRADGRWEGRYYIVDIAGSKKRNRYTATAIRK